MNVAPFLSQLRDVRIHNFEKEVTHFISVVGFHETFTPCKTPIEEALFEQSH